MRVAPRSPRGCPDLDSSDLGISNRLSLILYICMSSHLCEIGISAASRNRVRLQYYPLRASKKHCVFRHRSSEWTLLLSLCHIFHPILAQAFRARQGALPKSRPHDHILLAIWAKEKRHRLLNSSRILRYARLLCRRADYTELYSRGYSCRPLWVKSTST